MNLIIASPHSFDPNRAKHFTEVVVFVNFVRLGLSGVIGWSIEFAVALD